MKAPKIYVRDSGLLHHLLGIREVNDLMGHPGAGASWEGFAIEQIMGCLPQGASVSFYRTAAGAELDLVIEAGRKKIGIEIKFSSAPKVTKGFWQACEDTGVDSAYIVAPVRESYPFAEKVRVLPVLDLPEVLKSLSV